jgi:hypothetical protein
MTSREREAHLRSYEGCPCACPFAIRRSARWSLLPLPPPPLILSSSADLLDFSDAHERSKYGLDHDADSGDEGDTTDFGDGTERADSESDDEKLDYREVMVIRKRNPLPLRVPEGIYKGYVAPSYLTWRTAYGSTKATGSH